MKGEIELHNISFLILKVELHFNTNEIKDSTFHCQTIIIECLEVCKKRTVGLFVWSRDHCHSPCYSKYLNRK